MPTPDGNPSLKTTVLKGSWQRDLGMSVLVILVPYVLIHSLMALGSEKSIVDYIRDTDRFYLVFMIVVIALVSLYRFRNKPIVSFDDATLMSYGIAAPSAPDGVAMIDLSKDYEIKLSGFPTYWAMWGKLSVVQDAQRVEVLGTFFSRQQVSCLLKGIKNY